MKQCNHARLFLLFAIVFLVAFAGGTIDLAAKHRLIKATRESNEVLVSQVDSLIQDGHNLAVENHSWEESYTRLSGEYTKLQDEKKLVDEERSRVEEAKTKAEEARAKADRDNARLDGKVQVLASQSKDLTNKVAILSVTNTELVSTNKELDTKVLRLDYEKTDLEIRNADLEWRNKFLKARYEPNITLGQNDLFAFWGGELYGRSLELLGKEFSINQSTLYRDGTYYYLTIDKLKEVIAADSTDAREWINDKYDCDDFTDTLKARMAELGITAVGFVGGELRDPITNTLIAGHAWNLFWVYENGSPIAYYVDPQDDVMTRVTPGGTTLMNGKLYIPTEIRY